LKVLQINTTLNAGSTGRIAEDIGNVLLIGDHESHIAASRIINNSKSSVIKIGSKNDKYAHALLTRLCDRHGFGSVTATKQLIIQIDKLKPDIIHLHNIHGYFLNIKFLFEYLKKVKTPIVWTFHDCWPFTGHCAYFDSVNCFKWQEECNKCPFINGYPSSWHIDN